MLEFIVLGMLSDTPLTGYDLKKLIETGIGTFYKASYGSLYPLLKRLTERGLLTVHDEPQGNRPKKFYRATDQGKAAFFSWLSSPIDFTDNADNQLAKIYFFDKLPQDTRKQQLAEYQVSCTNYLRRLQGLLEEYESVENKDCFYYKLSTLYYGIAVMQTAVRWCSAIQNQASLADLLNQPNYVRRKE